CRSDGVPILRRASGGGTVMLGPGCLCFTLILSLERDPALREIRQSYAYIFDVIRPAIESVLPGLEQAGISDMAVAGRKISGSAQQRKRHCILHHATLLYDFDCSAVARYLRLPSRQPDYRVHRAHADFMCNLPMSADLLRERLRSAWDASREISPPM